MANEEKDILQKGYNDRKVTCPHCGSKNCFESTEEDTNTVSYLCLKCGYTSNTFFTEDSQQLKSSFTTAPTLISDLQFFDKSRKLVWIPCVLNMGKRGIIFPKGSKNNWKWNYAKVVDIDLNEQNKYPVPGKEGEFYKSKLDIENALSFEWDDFIGACEEMGITTDLIK
tara:strand:+ start:2470 stop:2976 length:507 start_codon:yes stop_codon:yes gene_type:complete